MQVWLIFADIIVKRQDWKFNIEDCVKNHEHLNVSQSKKLQSQSFNSFQLKQ